MMEQAIPFLSSLWINSVFIDPNHASMIGAIYVIARALYPIGFKLGPPYILFSTIPGYICIFVLLGEVVFKSF